MVRASTRVISVLASWLWTLMLPAIAPSPPGRKWPNAAPMLPPPELLVLAGDVGDDEVVGRQHLAAAEVGAALQLAGAVQALFLVAHGQALVAVDHPQAARLQREHLQHRFGVGEAERAPPVAVRLLDRGDADRAVAVREVAGATGGRSCDPCRRAGSDRRRRRWRRRRGRTSPGRLEAYACGAPF